MKTITENLKQLVFGFIEAKGEDPKEILMTKKDLIQLGREFHNLMYWDEGKRPNFDEEKFFSDHIENKKTSYFLGIKITLEPMIEENVIIVK